MRFMRKRAETPLRIGTVSNYRHLWMLVFWVIYLVLFAVVEHEVQSDYYVMHCALDDIIPFCEWFIFPYCLWHPLLFAMTLYLSFWDAENFKPYITFIALGFIPVILFDWAFPNGQDLRPAVFAHQNIATWLVGRIYAADTNTNVFPSMHVIGSAALVAAALHTPSLRKRKLHLVAIPVGVLICISTVFVKQHSCLDLIGAIPYSALLWWLIYGVIYKKRKNTAQS